LGSADQSLEIRRDVFYNLGTGKASSQSIRKAAELGWKPKLPRANVLKQASMLADFHSPFFLDDINYSYTPDDYGPTKTLHISIFDGKDWQISEKSVMEKFPSSRRRSNSW
jgi:hypothetical protein